jgi:hypothetical protein
MKVNAGDFHDLRNVRLLSEGKVESQSVELGPFYHTCRNRGLEDARLLLIDGGQTLAFSCVSLEFTSTNLPRIVWVELKEAQGGSYLTEKMTLITGYDDDEAQKNWLPFLWDGGRGSNEFAATKNTDIYFIYNYSPLTILKFDRESSTVRLYKQVNLPIHSSEWRGSSGPVKLPDNNWLLLIHEVCDRPDNRYYMHRFVLMNHDFSKLQGTSDLFYFKNSAGVEMANGLIYANGELLISVGIEDCQAILVKVAWKDVERVMIAVE